MVFVCLDPTIGYCPEDSTFQSNFNMSWSKAPPGMKSYQTCSLPRIGKHARSSYTTTMHKIYGIANWRVNGRINIFLILLQAMLHVHAMIMELGACQMWKIANFPY